MTKNDLGPQPLDQAMTRLGLSNVDLVRVSTDQLTHKMVQKGRKGKRISLKIQTKILVALRRARPGEPLTLQELFNNYD